MTTLKTKQKPRGKPFTPGGDPRVSRGFASLPPERQREIAALGGRTAHARGHAYTFTPEKAREAGRLGGLARARKAGRG